MKAQSIQLLPYAHEAFGELRTAHLDGQPWFVATDVCRSLEIANSRDAVARLRQAEKVTVGLTDSGNRPYKITLVNEPGLYRLIFTSRKKEAEVFQDWVFTDVLPSIRKTGTYTMPDAPRPAFDPLADCDAKLAALSIRGRQGVAAYEALLALRQRLAGHPVPSPDRPDTPANHQSASDTLPDYVSERLIQTDDPRITLPVTDLWRDYLDWCRTARPPLRYAGRHTLSKGLARLRIGRGRRRIADPDGQRTVHIVGLRLLTPVNH